MVDFLNTLCYVLFEKTYFLSRFSNYLKKREKSETLGEKPRKLSRRSYKAHHKQNKTNKLLYTSNHLDRFSLFWHILWILACLFACFFLSLFVSQDH